MRASERRHGAWTEHSEGDTVRFDFAPPRHWHAERIHAERAAVLDALVSLRPSAGMPSASWLALAQAMPPVLRTALILELLAGNCMLSIACRHWSRCDGVVVTLRDRFQRANRGLAPQLRWCAIGERDDCREALTQRQHTVEHELVA